MLLRARTGTIVRVEVNLAQRKARVFLAALAPHAYERCEPTFSTFVLQVRYQLHVPIPLTPRVPGGGCNPCTSHLFRRLVGFMCPLSALYLCLLSNCD